MTLIDSDTICAVATPSGQGGIGIVRLSGPEALSIGEQITAQSLIPRHAHYCKFFGRNSEVIEQGIALFFAGPHSFTGEDSIELQGHGGSYSIQTILRRAIECGARLADPGEFSERAFLNGKIDLLQAEAIADLIEASSEQAAKSALKTLEGEFSRKITDLVTQLIAIRVEVEAAIDFSDEDIDLQALTTIADLSQAASAELDNVLVSAEQGALLKKGLTVAIVGKPNAGKSSLLNALAKTDRAIVTAIPGTTRDILSEQINIDGLPLNIVDTAGLRHTDDPVEKEGVRRANQAVLTADKLLLVIDIAENSITTDETLTDVLKMLASTEDEHQSLLKRLSIVLNKTDLLKERMILNERTVAGVIVPTIQISAKTDTGLDQLRTHLKESVNYLSTGEESFIARERHLTSLKSARKSLNLVVNQISEHSHWDIVAEELRIAQQELNKITGNFSSDDLLGEIFSNFCVGK